MKIFMFDHIANKYKNLNITSQAVTLNISYELKINDDLFTKYNLSIEKHSDMKKKFSINYDKLTVKIFTRKDNVYIKTIKQPKYFQ